jgi:hypothetical protein
MNGEHPQGGTVATGSAIDTSLSVGNPKKSGEK